MPNKNPMIMIATCLLTALIPAWAGAIEATTLGDNYRQLLVQDNKLLAADSNRQWFLITVTDSMPVARSIEAPDTTRRNWPKDILPDGVVVTESKNIRRAWLGGPTTRYDHAVLGDDLEASRLYAVDRDGQRYVYELPPQYVFEDRYPRLVDLDGDGDDEIVVIRSDLNDGAGVALYGLRDGRLKELAASAPIGRRNRWLNVVGTADFDRDGHKEIAIVITPHIGGTLTLLRRRDDKLVTVLEQHGYSNHEYGSPELGMSAVLDINGDQVPDMAVPGADRESLVLVTVAQGQFRTLHRVPHPAAIVSGIEVVDLDQDGSAELVYLLKDGTLAVISN